MIKTRENITTVSGMIKITFKDMVCDTLDKIAQFYQLKDYSFIIDFMNSGAEYIGIEVIKTYTLEENGDYILSDFNDVKLIAVKLDNEIDFYTKHINAIDINEFYEISSRTIKFKNLYNIAKEQEVVNDVVGDFTIEDISDKILTKGYASLTDMEENFFLTYNPSYYNDMDLDDVLNRVKEEGIDSLCNDDYRYLKTLNEKNRTYKGI